MIHKTSLSGSTSNWHLSLFGGASSKVIFFFVDSSRNLSFYLELYQDPKQAQTLPRVGARTPALVSLPQAMQLSRRHAVAAAASLTLAVLAALRLRRRRLAASAVAAATPHVIVTAAAAEAACAEWLHAIRAGRLPAAIGLDAEWVKGQPPALLQLSCGAARRTLLLRLCAFRHEPPPPSLCALLSDGTILKAGVGVVADLARLEATLGLAVSRGGAELSSVKP